MLGQMYNPSENFWSFEGREAPKKLNGRPRWVKGVARRKGVEDVTK